MGHLDKEVFICLDCETTGLDAEKDHIIEVAAMRFTLNETLETFETLVDPCCPISETSMKIHNITDNMVQGKPKIADILPGLLNFIGRNTIIGHGVGFDVSLLCNAAKRSSIPCNIHNNSLLDTLRMARLYGESPVNSLEHLRQHFNIQPEDAHRAFSDVTVNVEVFKFLAQKYRTTESLFDALSRPIMMKNMPLGKHKGRPLKEIPLAYLLWAANKEFDQDLLFSIRSEIKKRKKGNLFCQANNPFSGL